MASCKQARTLIDEAVVSPAHVKDPEAWLLRGFVYKDLFKGMPGGEQADAVRDTALASLTTCLAIDTEGTYRDNAVQAYDFLARSCFNDAAKALNDMRGGTGGSPVPTVQGRHPGTRPQCFGPERP